MNEGTKLTRYGALGCLVASTVLAVGIGLVFETAGRTEEYLSNTTWTGFLCGDLENVDAGSRIRLYTAQAYWVGVMGLNAIVATFSLAFAVVLIAVMPGCKDVLLQRRGWVFVLLGLLAVAIDVALVMQMRSPATPKGFLTQLLATLHYDCDSIRLSVFWARVVAEPVGVLVGVAMAAMGVFAQDPKLPLIAERLGGLRKLLYVGSVLFVVGILMSRANFEWVLAHWHVDAESDVAIRLAEMVDAGVVQSGVAYSGLLATFYLPVRMLLSRQAHAAVPDGLRTNPAARKKWLTDKGLSDSWQEDVQQILALLGPVLSAPILDLVT